MPNYSLELERIEKLVKEKDYIAAINKSFRITELGLKQLYKNLQSYLGEEEFDELHQAFLLKQKEPFRVNRANFGGMLLFAKSTDFWKRLREMCESNLRFISMINWERIRLIRNQVAHNDVDLNRYDALELYFWAKVFLYETGLIEGVTNPEVEVLDTDCSTCNFKISLSWNYCPHCGNQAHRNCSKCHRKIANSHKICPHCDHKQTPVKVNKKERSQYKDYVEAVWADWVVTPLERAWLKQKRLDLGISEKEAGEIEKEVVPEGYLLLSKMLEMSLVDGDFSRHEKELLLKTAENLNIPKDFITNMISATKSPRKQRLIVSKIMAMF